MLLTAHQLVRYLVRTHPAKLQAVGLRLQTQLLPANRSQNQCFLAYWGDEMKWFVKQPYFPGQYESFGIANEARFYALTSPHGAPTETTDTGSVKVPNEALRTSLSEALKQHSPGLHQVVPGFVGYDPRYQVLLLEYLLGFKSLASEPFDGGSVLPDSDVPERVAYALRQVHWPLSSAGDQNLRNQQLQYFIAFRPALLRNRAASVPQLLSSSGRPKGMFLAELETQLTSKPVMEQLHSLSDSEWQEACLIHGDAAWRNWMFKIRTDVDDRSTQVDLRLVDWERASWGDPRWDHALFLEGYLRKRMDPRPHAERLHRAYYENDPNGPKLEEWLSVTLRLAALNLIQNTVERFTNLSGKSSSNRSAEERLLIQENRWWFGLMSEPHAFLNHFLPTNYDAVPRRSVAELGS